MRRAAVLAVGLGLIVVPLSELMFWPVEARSIAGLVAFYAACALLAAILLDRSGARGWVGYVLAGGIFGWLVEGVVVNQTYEAVPFSLAWTPLAWHMAITVMVGVVAMGRALRTGFAPALIWAAIIGGFAGLWGAYGWTALAEDVATPETGLPFAVQMVVSSVMLAVGHFLLCRLPAGPVPVWVLWALLGLAGFVWSVAWAVPMFPASLSVPVVVGVSVLALWHAGCETAPEAAQVPVPLSRYLVFGVIPVVAIPLQQVVLGASWRDEINAFVAFPLTILGSAAWLAAVLVGLWRGRQARGR